MSEPRHPTVAEAGPVHDQREIDAVVARPAGAGSPRHRPARSPSSSAAGAELLAKQHAVMVNSGTSALWLAVDLLGCEPGDEVITSPLTFSSDIAPLVRNGIVPAFVDVEADTLQIDVTKIEAMIGPRTKAILTPNLVGNCPDWDAIRAIADRHGLLVVEDSCDVLDSYLRGTRTGHALRHLGHQLRPRAFDHRREQRRHDRGRRPRVVRPDARAPPVGPSLASATCSAASRATTTASARSPTARPTTWCSSSRTPATTSSRRRSAPRTATCSSTASPSSTSGAATTSPASTRCSRSTRTRWCAPRTTPDVDTTWMRFPFLLARRHRPHRDAGVPARAGDPVAHGVDRQHPAPARLRRHRPPGARRRACPRPTG